MIINFEKIKELLKNENLKEGSRQTGIPYRTLQNWKLGSNTWLKDVEDRLYKLNDYIKKKEVIEMKMIELLEEVSTNEFNAIHDFVDTNVEYEKDCTLTSGWEDMGLTAFNADGEKFKKMNDAEKEEYAQSFAENLAKDCLSMNYLDYFHDFSDTRVSGTTLKKIKHYIAENNLKGID